MVNSNWARWIFASLSKHFYDGINTAGLPIFIEGESRRSSNPGNDYCEFRFDGPYFCEHSHKYWEILAEINILIVSFINETDLHKIHRTIGTVTGLCTCIPIMRYGDGVDDNPDSQIGVMDIIQQGRERIMVTNFGQIQSDASMLQATVEVMYKMNLWQN